MVLLMSRRTIAYGILGAYWHHQEQTVYPSESEMIDLIQHYTPPEFIHAVQTSGKLLYRGEDNSYPAIIDAKTDLLVEGTYDEKDAVEYFTCLEKRLINTKSCPSTGHIGTSDQMEAAKWGTVSSIWPLGSHLSYVWPRHTSVFYPNGPTCSRSSSISSSYAMDQGLTMALKKEHEVLFYSWFEDESVYSTLRLPTNTSSCFLAVPSNYDSLLLSILQQN